jgi:hypothetical protein
MEGMIVERRLRQLEDAFCPPGHAQLRSTASHVAEQRGLDSELVFHEAMVVLQQIGERRLSLHDLAPQEDISPDELTRMTHELRAYWQRVA